MERALCDARKHFNHWIRAILLIHVRETDDIGAVSEKASAQKFVDHDNVDDLGNDQLKFSVVDLNFCLNSPH